ncbi:MAG TPA: hydrogenase maturation protease [bacterium]|nr:hydrogenase maturation protease [bacterium]
MKTLVLGLGNPILSDDGIGIKAARAIKKRVKDIEVVEASAAGFRIVDQILGFDKLILIDAIQTKNWQTGTIHKLKPENFKNTKHSSSTHDISFFQALDIYRENGEAVPADIEIYVVEVEQTDVFSEKLTAEVEKALPEVVNKIIKDNFA